MIAGSFSRKVPKAATSASIRAGICAMIFDKIPGRASMSLLTSSGKAFMKEPMT